MNRVYFHLIFATTLFIVALICYAFWYGALGALSFEVAALSSEVTAKNQSAAQALVAEDELAKLSAEENIIHGYFVSTADIVSFLEGLQTLGSFAGAKVSVVSVSANPSPRPHLDLALKVSGSFDAVMRAVGAIEYSAHDIQVTTLTLDTVTSLDPKIPSGWAAALVLQVGTASSTPLVSKPANNATSTQTTTP